MRARRPRQLGLVFRTHGGARRGAGRKPNGQKAGVSHLARPSLGRRTPVHVTLRMQRGVWNLRSRRCFTALARAFAAGGRRDDFCLVHYAVLGDHLHLLVEAESRAALSRGMQGLSIRIARALNRVMGRQGRVFADRYHARALRTLTEVRARRAALSGPQRAPPLRAGRPRSLCLGRALHDAADLSAAADLLRPTSS